MGKHILFLNGATPKRWPTINKLDKIYCTDGAFAYLQANQIEPNLVIGDFDSIAPESIPTTIPTQQIADQDSTDFEKALHCLTQQNIALVEVYGASGKEQDHFLGNLSAALRYKHKIKLVFFDDCQRYFFLEPKDTIHTKIGKLVSFFPFPTAKEVFATGLQYPINGLDFELGKQIGIRNHATKTTIEIRFSNGNLLAFVQH